MVVALAGDDYARDCVATEGSAEADVLVGYEGAFDMANRSYDVVDLTPLRDEDPELWRALDPYAHLGGNPDLVVRLVHGDDEDVAWYEMPRAVSAEFNQALREAGYDADLTLLDGLDHNAIKSPGSEAVVVIAQRAIDPAE